MLLANWRRIFVCYVFIHVLDRPAHMILGFLNIVRHFGKAPSTAAKSDEYVKIQAKLEFAIHDGLYPKPVTNCKSNSKPMTTVAPPVHIFHPIFKQFISDANDPHLASFSYRYKSSCPLPPSSRRLSRPPTQNGDSFCQNS